MTDPAANPLFPEGAVACVAGAGGGLGSALVERLLDDPRWHRVHALTRTPARHRHLCDLAARHGDRLAVVGCDTTRERSLARAATTVAERDEAVHLAIVATGVLHDERVRPEKKIADCDGARLAHSFAVNAIAPLLVAKALAPLLRRAEPSVFAALSARVGSIADNGLGGWYGYRASKAALNMFVRTLARELGRGPAPTLCVALHPGTVATELSRPFLGSADPRAVHSPLDAAARLLAVLDGLGPEANGGFFAWDGAPVPW